MRRARRGVDSSTSMRSCERTSTARCAPSHCIASLYLLYPQPPSFSFPQFPDLEPDQTPTPRSQSRGRGRQRLEIEVEDSKMTLSTLALAPNPVPQNLATMHTYMRPTFSPHPQRTARETQNERIRGSRAGSAANEPLEALGSDHARAPAAAGPVPSTPTPPHARGLALGVLDRSCLSCLPFAASMQFELASRRVRARSWSRSRSRSWSFAPRGGVCVSARTHARARCCCRSGLQRQLRAAASSRQEVEVEEEGLSCVVRAPRRR